MVPVVFWAANGKLKRRANRKSDFWTPMRIVLAFLPQ
jgi:hypothetical protein